MSPSAPLPFDAALSSPDALEALISTLRPHSIATAPAPAAEPSRNSFFDALRTQGGAPQLAVHGTTINATPSTKDLMLTDNLGVTNATTGSAGLDLFDGLGSVDKASLPELLRASWDSNADETLRIIWSARSIPRGKGEKEAWLRGAAWMAEYHPQTLLRNLLVLVQPTDAVPRKRKADALDVEDDMEVVEMEDVAEELLPSTARSHGYYKDLVNLLVLANSISSTTTTGSNLSVTGDFTLIPGCAVDPASPFAASRTKPGRRVTASKQVEKQTKDDLKAATSARVAQALTTDGSFYRALHLSVARIFGTQLKLDWEALKMAKDLRAAGKVDEAVTVEKKITLAAKWAPSEGCFHDRHTRIASSIAEAITPIERLGQRTTAGVSHSLSVYRTILVGLRKHLEVPEVKASANEWGAIRYNRVPSIAMSKLKTQFNKHDPERFKAYLTDVALGKAKISGAVMTPAVLLSTAISATGINEEVIELQWKTLVQSIRDTGFLSECIAVADVSGSMQSPQLADKTTPLHSSIALSLLVSRVTAPPFANSIISFTDQPHFIDFDPEATLKDAYRQILREGTGYNTDFIAVFRQILSKARKAKLAPENMIKKVFVFSDMEFDHCQNSYRAGNSYATHYEIVKREFEKAGYPMPSLVFWNLAAGKAKNSKAVREDVPGTAMVGGYSAAMIKVFLDGGDFGDDVETFEEVLEDGTTRTVKKEMTPRDIMLKAIYHPSFAGLKVYD